MAYDFAGVTLTNFVVAYGLARSMVAYDNTFVVVGIYFY